MEAKTRGDRQSTTHYHTRQLRSPCALCINHNLAADLEEGADGDIVVSLMEAVAIAEDRTLWGSLATLFFDGGRN